MSLGNLLKAATAAACLASLAAGFGADRAYAEDKVTIIMDGGPVWAFRAYAAPLDLKPAGDASALPAAFPFVRRLAD
jgi:hypothetical protein